jgi:hypothetical protein
MTYKEKYDQSDTWQEKAAIISQFHWYKSLKTDNWSMKKTAKYFDVSIGLVSENVTIIKNFDKVKHMEFRQQAIDYLRR